MFNNCGEKIKNVAKILCWVGVIASIILSRVMFMKAEDSYLTEDLFQCLGWLFSIAGPIISLINGLLMYGFGELIENTASSDTYTKSVCEIPANSASANETDDNVSEIKKLLADGTISEEEYNKLASKKEG